MSAARVARNGLWEVVATWLLYAVAGVGVLVTYSRLPPAELYNTSVGVRPLRGDGVRVALAAALLVLAIPWLFAEAGFYAPDPIYADERPRAETGENTLAAVHLGFHHGTAGVEFALVALLLSRTIPRFRHRRLALVTSAYLSLMLAYGIANAAQDGWGEQVVKRGLTSASIPGLIRPGLSLWWALILAVAAAAWLLWFRSDASRFRRVRALDPDVPGGGAAEARPGPPR